METKILFRPAKNDKIAEKTPGKKHLKNAAFKANMRTKDN